MLNEIKLKANQHLFVSGSYCFYTSCTHEMSCDKCALFDDVINENKIAYVCPRKKMKMLLL